MQSDIYQTQAQHYLINTYARFPITLVKGSGAFVWDVNGKKYLDFLCGIGCTPLGHCHPAIEHAILKQMKFLLHTSNLYHSPPNIQLAQWLVEHGGLDKIFFCNSGAEANEAAIKFVRKFQWRRNLKEKNIILSAQHAFHGRTLGALAATAKPNLHEGFGPLPLGFHYQSIADTEAFCRSITSDVAAVILEPIQGEGGIHPLSATFLAAVRQACSQAGALLIFDEVQCGIGRTGELFAYQYFGVKPDVITLAKGIANGLPLGAVCVTKEVADMLMPRDHGSTFGGNPLACAAALATLNTLVNQNYLLQVRELSHYLVTQLNLLQKKFPQQIKAVRGIGLMLGIEVNANPSQVLYHCQQNGLLVNITAETVLRLLPPYIINKLDIDWAIDILTDSFK